MLHNESMEMYLETILRLCKFNEKVRAVDIANQMRISKVSVCHAIKNLQAKDYVTYESRLIRLTKKVGFWPKRSMNAIVNLRNY